MYSTNQFRKGLKIELDGQPYIMIDFQHVSPGKGSAFTRTKLKNLITNNTLDRTFKNNEKIRVPDIEEKTMQYMYTDGNAYHVMDVKTYDQLELTAKQVGDRKNYLQEGINLSILFFNGSAISVETPNFVVLTVTKTEPGIRGDTASGGSKPATLETGAVLQVPFHINEGEKIKVDTRDGSYVEKAV